MDKIALFTILAISFLVTIRFGLPKLFVYVLLPAMLLLWSIRQMDVPVLPNLSTAGAVAYGVLLGLPLIWHDPRKRPFLHFNALDWWVTLMIVPMATTAIATEGPWAAIGVTATKLFEWWMPYILARMALADLEARRQLVKALCIYAIVLGCLAAIEARLMPMFVSRALAQAGLNTVDNVQRFERYGLSRALVTMEHHIDLGNVGVILGSMILGLCWTVGRSWRDPLVIAGVLGAGLMVGGSISFTCFMALGLAALYLILLSNRSLGPTFCMIIATLTILGGASVSAYLINKPLGPKPQDMDSGVEGSVWNRTMIVQDSWDVAQQSGLFGFGRLDMPFKQIGVGSVDNSYMLFIMRNGWVDLCSWLVLIVMLGYKGSQMLTRAVGPTERWPVICILAGTFAILAAMYTVWYGFVYAVLLCCLLGMMGTMIELFERRIPAVAVPRRGLPVINPQPRGA